MEFDRCYQRDIENLNSSYIGLLKKELGCDNNLLPVLRCMPSAIKTIRGLNSVQPLVACNVLQYQVVVTDEPINSNLGSSLEFQNIVGQTFLLYRELAKLKHPTYQFITGHQLDTSQRFTQSTYSELNDLAKSNHCLLQMRFFETYWENIKNFVADGKDTLMLASATQAANEAIVG